MTDNPVNHEPDEGLNDDEFCQSLQALRPARGDIDVREVFFAAGREAARRRESRGFEYPFVSAVAAALAGVILSAPLAYRIGRTGSAPIAMPIADQSRSDTVDPAESPQPEPLRQPETDQPPPLDPANGLLASDLDEREQTSIDVSARATLAAAFTSWLALDQRVAATQLDRASESTLSAFHASLVSRDHPLRDLAEYPLPSVGDSILMSSQTDLTDPSDLAVRPLFLGDRQMVFSNLEESR